MAENERKTVTVREELGYVILGSLAFLIGAALKSTGALESLGTWAMLIGGIVVVVRLASLGFTLIKPTR